MKSVYLIIDNQNRVRSVENKKEKAESDARYLSVSHASRPYRVVRLHFDGPHRRKRSIKTCATPAGTLMRSVSAGSHSSKSY